MAQTTLGGPVRTTDTGFQVISVNPSTGAVTVLATFGAATSVTSVSTGALTASGAVILSGLPTSDPAVAGQLWSNSGVLTVSAG